MSRRALDQAGRKAAFPAQAPFDALHSCPVPRALMIVPQQVQQPVQSQDFQLGGVRMAGSASLAPRHTGGNRDVAEFARREA